MYRLHRKTMQGHETCQEPKSTANIVLREPASCDILCLK
jgi:hypothetical protein